MGLLVFGEQIQKSAGLHRTARGAMAVTGDHDELLVACEGLLVGAGEDPEPGHVQKGHLGQVDQHVWPVWAEERVKAGL